jgi:hypothetical protein
MTRMVPVSHEVIDEVGEVVTYLANHLQEAHGCTVPQVLQALMYSFGHLCGQTNAQIPPEQRLLDIDAFKQGYEQGLLTKPSGAAN